MTTTQAVTTTTAFTTTVNSSTISPSFVNNEKKISKIQISQRSNNVEEKKKKHKHSKKHNISKHSKLDNENIQKLLPSTRMRSEFDAENRVHVIHVSAKDHYDQLIASPEFSGIISRYSEAGNDVNIPELVCNILY